TKPLKPFRSATPATGLPPTGLCYQKSLNLKTCAFTPPRWPNGHNTQKPCPWKTPPRAANKLKPNSNNCLRNNMTSNRSDLIAGLIAFTGFLVWFVSIRQSLLFLVGIGFGLVLAGMRFGFTTGWRNLIEKRDPSGVYAQLLLLAIAAAISLPLLAAYPSELSAALGPPSISLLVGALVFGAAMQVADGCGSGTLYKAGLGIPLNMAILPMFALGSFLGSVHLGWWLDLGALEPVSLLDSAGLTGALISTFAGLALLAAFAAWWGRQRSAGSCVLNKTLLVGAVLLAGLAVLNLIIAGQPWGIVYGFGLWGAKAAQAANLFDPASNAFWS